jgi:hypothetical protein
MIIDRSHQHWIFGTTAAALAATLFYSIYAAASPNGPRGGSIPGLIFAFTGTGLIVFECLLSARKRYPASPFGRVHTWLRAHVWLGLLSLLLICFHAGWRWGQGLETVLMWLYLIITLSGILGLVLQRYLPQRITEQIPRETIYEQIPFVVRHLRIDADERVEFVTADLGVKDEETEQEIAGTFLAGGIKFHFDPAQRKSAQEKVEAEIARRKSQAQIAIEDRFAEALKAQYIQEIRPFLFQRPAAYARGTFPTADAVKAYFQHLRTIMPVATHDVLEDLEGIVDERRQLLIQERMHYWLHGWLWVHMPLSMAFLVLTAVHAVLTLRY